MPSGLTSRLAQPTIAPPAPTGSGAVDSAVALWRALAALGVRHAVLSPGSRSAPLVYALADPQREHPLTAHVRIDERAAAFTALGISRATPAHPAAVATTSGTAVAHLLAAAMEAHHSHIPLLLLTADRPAELRGTGANQTTHQPGLFADVVRFRADIPAPTADGATRAELRTIVDTAARAMAAARGEDPGPVHLNLCFRDPLVPREGRLPDVLHDSGTTGPERERMSVAHRVRPQRPQPVHLSLDAGTVVVAGDGAGDVARRFAEDQLLPLLAEPSSGARCGAAMIPGYPVLLREIMRAGSDAAEPDSLRPHRAIVFGHPTLSRPVIGGLLGADDVEVIVVDPRPSWNDPSRSAALVVPAITAEPPAGAQAEQRAEVLAAWRERGTALAAGCHADHDSAARAELSWQVRAALAVWDASAEGDHLVLGSSSLVRDLEQHAGPARAQIHANRGLAGIDGTIATATGLALACHERATNQGAPGGRVRVLLGDLTALHDLTGMLIGPDEYVPALEVIVVDDDGGRIFSGLEHAAAPPELLRRFFTTPHGADIAGAARALGWEAQQCTSADLPGLLQAPPDPSAPRRLLLVRES